jgi:predicted HD superfamily hydrolase involved in NAD metabolism
MEKITVDEALRLVKNKNEARYNHILGTMEMATHLAIKYSQDVYKCQIAAIFHDVAKHESIHVLTKIINEHDLKIDCLNYSPDVYHGPVGAYVAETQYGITDQDILDAIAYHVTGSPEMNDIAKIIYVSDFIEKNRKHDGVAFCRYLSEQSLDLGVLGVSECVLTYLYQKNALAIHPLSRLTYETFLEKVGVNQYEFIKNRYQSL